MGLLNKVGILVGGIRDVVKTVGSILSDSKVAAVVTLVYPQSAPVIKALEVVGILQDEPSTNEEKKTKAIVQLRKFLNDKGISYSGGDLNFLVELAVKIFKGEAKVSAGNA